MAILSNLKTYEPFADVVRGTPMFDFTGLFDLPRTRFAYPTMRDVPDIKMDVTETPADYRVCAEIPGVRKEDIHVAVEGNTISISAEVERKTEPKKDETQRDETVLCRELFHGKVARSFTVMCDVDESRSAAKYENGILELTLPKKQCVLTTALEVK